jgi:hypothetical protein
VAAPKAQMMVVVQVRQAEFFDQEQPPRRAIY